LIALIDRQDRPLPTDALLVELKNPQRSDKIRIACLKALLTRPPLHRWMCWQTLDQSGPEAEFLMPSLAELLSQKSETNYAGQERYQQFLDFMLLTTLERLGPTAAPVVPVLESALSDM